MASTLIKITIGLFGATTFAGGATAIYLTSRNKETTSESNQTITLVADKVINTLLVKEKIRSLTDEKTDNDKWKVKWGTFKSRYETLKDKESWKFDNWNDAKSQEDQSIQILKRKCTDNIQKKVVDENSQLLLDVKEFCTEPVPNA